MTPQMISEVNFFHLQSLKWFFYYYYYYYFYYYYYYYYDHHHHLGCQMVRQHLIEIIPSSLLAEESWLYVFHLVRLSFVHKVFSTHLFPQFLVDSKCYVENILI